MEQEIIANRQNPAELEKLYRTDTSGFKRAFNQLYPTQQENVLMEFWHTRLNFQEPEKAHGDRKEIFFVIVAALLAGVVAKLPVILGLEEDVFFQRNIGFVVFPFLVAFYAWRNQLPAGKIALLAGAILLSLIFINLLPGKPQRDTLVLSCVHLPLFLWSIWGFSFTTSWTGNTENRLAFLRFNGDLVVMTGLILIAGLILSGITIGLFSLIGLKIERIIIEYFGVFGLAAAPILGNYLVRRNPQLVDKVSPMIARIFSPLVLVMLAAYLIAMVYSRKDPYNDREFLMIFNALLVGVLALIFFSAAGTPKTEKSVAELWILFLLCAATVVVTGIALSAIIFRIAQWGITPNRVAVLGGDALILVHLSWIGWQLFRVIFRKVPVSEVGSTIVRFLPVYTVWAMIVTFLFPLLFGFR